MDEIMELNVPSSSGERKKKYKGVRRRKWGRWVAEIRLPHSRERIWLGSYDTPEKAARAFDAAYVCLRGPTGGADGLINFPSSPPDVAGRTTDPDEVYAAAVSHANRATVFVSGAGEAPWDANANATEPSSEEVHDGASPEAEAAAAVEAAPLEVADDESSGEWSARLVADELPPLYSPMYAGSDAYTYMPAVSSYDMHMEENESASCCCPGLWSFDPSECHVVAERQVVDVQRNQTNVRSNFPDVSDRDG
ncbi:hypothetical protein HU200_015575 [Digitaria exilis]|uniref:AP2/ERF domain-containing protein n=1 Tax=Digitaria exilis TaxID=1010633 RepID=A0A835KL24_9POAL|nr:hypothetical protein HU200_015575 [Digitaria exilis]CAB3469875.1 unnamed protein product [Digitaria exilis]